MNQKTKQWKSSGVQKKPFKIRKMEKQMGNRRRRGEGGGGEIKDERQGKRRRAGSDAARGSWRGMRTRLGTWERVGGECLLREGTTTQG